jgi:hypothetical protein
MRFSGQDMKPVTTATGRAIEGHSGIWALPPNHVLSIILLFLTK